jgi:hypothetical protein
MHEVGQFQVEIPLEIDFTVGTNYGKTRDWDGSEEDLVSAIKWLCEETAKRDKTKVVDYKKLMKTQLYKKFPTGYVHKVIQRIIKRDMKRARQWGIN